ncbi:MAG: NAD(P)H-dependent oxidoreductase subunit E [Gammaproteobacteria bacterium]|nr:NAD(P)H-dependent oxidoreductase subunit E [Gammaproteobacteria bacterium]
MNDNTFYNIPSEICTKINEWLLKFPDGKKKPAIIFALHQIQKENKFIKKTHINSIAKFLRINEIDVYEVAAFYSMFELDKIGKHTISVCTNVSCMLNGSDEILSYLEEKLDLKVGTSSDKFFLKDERECLAACCGAPMMQVNHKYYENLTKEKIDEIIRDIDNE